MSYILQFSNTVDFNGRLTHSKTENFRQQINANPSILTECSLVQIQGDLVEIGFAEPLQGNDEAELRTMVASRYYDPSIFDAIVDARGNGDFMRVADAFLAGRTSVFVRNGIYIETENIVLPDGGQLVGESQSNVKIVLVAGNSVRVDGSEGAKINTGTVSVVHNSPVVTGTGTSFTALQPGSYILLGTNFYEILSIESDTSLTLVATYQGHDLSQFSCLAQRMHTGVRICNLVIANSGSIGLYIRAVRHCTFRGVAVLRCSPNIAVLDSGDSSLCEFICGFSNGIGLSVENSHSMLFSTLDIYNSTSHGLVMNAGSSSNVIDSSSTSNNAGTGIVLTNQLSHIILKQNVSKSNRQDGITADASSNYLTLAGCTVAGNGGVGINFLGTFGVICNNIVQKNASHGIRANFNCTVGSNIVNLNGGSGLDSVAAGSADMSVTSNQFLSNSGCGAKIKAANSIVSNNTALYNGESGIECDGTRVVLSGNNASSNTLHGVHLTENASKCLLNNNVAGLNASHGIFMHASIVDNLISLNFVTNNTIAQINSSSELAAQGNEISNNKIIN